MIKKAAYRSSVPLVSIVIPVYNGARYLRIAIDSVLEQSYPNLELIVLDDGSVDNTREVLRSYPHASFRWESQANMGQAATLNKGWSMAEGEILSYLSADDALLPQAVDRAVHMLAMHDDVIMVYGDYHLIDAKGNRIRKVEAPEFDYRKMLAEIEVQPGPGVFFRRSGFDAIGGWDPRYRQIPDYEYWIRLGLLGPFERIPQALALFRVHDDSQSHAPQSIEKSEEILGAIAEFFSNSGLSDSVKTLQRRSQAFALVIAARYHLRAGRYGKGLSRLFAAWRTEISTLWARRSLNLIGNALLYRWRNLAWRMK
ncbi:MAG: glycosyltransferase [Methylococcaceae bacterium]|nr:glycosyltransferase [Methylococcaceae bacterium]